MQLTTLGFSSVLKLSPKCYRLMTGLSMSVQPALQLQSSRVQNQPAHSTGLGQMWLTSSLNTAACSLQPGKRWIKFTTCNQMYKEKQGWLEWWSSTKHLISVCKNFDNFNTHNSPVNEGYIQEITVGCCYNVPVKLILVTNSAFHIAIWPLL